MQIVHISAILMDNGEIISMGNSLGFYSEEKDNFKIVKRFDAITGEEITE